MESVRRGPRCAKRLLARLAAESAAARPVVRVLRGGADRWIRRYWKGPLVEGFDGAYWGWCDAASPSEMGADSGIGGQDSSVAREGQEMGMAVTAGTRMHSLYTRPSDQAVDE
jgi:hypothetical protein